MNIKKRSRTKLIISWSILPTLEKLSLLIQSEKKRINDKTTDPILQQWSIGILRWTLATEIYDLVMQRLRSRLMHRRRTKRQQCNRSTLRMQQSPRLVTTLVIRFLQHFEVTRYTWLC